MTAAVSPLPPIVVPRGLRTCGRCGIKMPIQGFSAVSASNYTRCTECAGEGPAPTLPELLAAGELRQDETERREKHARLDITPEIVAEWAAMRRDGATYDVVERRGTLNPDRCSVLRYLKQYGYDKFGERLPGSSSLPGGSVP